MPHKPPAKPPIICSNLKQTREDTRAIHCHKRSHVWTIIDHVSPLDDLPHSGRSVWPSSCCPMGVVRLAWSGACFLSGYVLHVYTSCLISNYQRVMVALDWNFGSLAGEKKSEKKQCMPPQPKKRSIVKIVSPVGYRILVLKPTETHKLGEITCFATALVSSVNSDVHDLDDL